MGRVVELIWCMVGGVVVYGGKVVSGVSTGGQQCPHLPATRAACVTHYCIPPWNNKQGVMI